MRSAQGEEMTNEMPEWMKKRNEAWDEYFTEKDSERESREHEEEEEEHDR